jgi:ribosome-binding protein aMBF1 (putative translation factor)
MPQLKSNGKIIKTIQEPPVRYGQKTVQKRLTKKSAPRSNASKLPKQFPQINKRFVDLRKELGISQEALSEKMNVTRSMIKSIENGMVIPNLWCIIQMSRVANVSCDFILTGADFKPRSA